MARSVIATLPARALAHHRDELIDRARDAETPTDFFTAVSARLRRLVPYDGALWMATDPASGLPTVPTVLEKLEHADPGRRLSYWEGEFLVEDVNLFRDLLRSATPAASLRGRTDDRPARSRRYRKFLRPMGIDDELRAVLRSGQSQWGQVSLMRESGRPPFAPEETALVASLSAPLADALRARVRVQEDPAAAVLNAPGS